MKRKDKSTIFINSLFLVTLVVMIAGATFAWFSAKVTGNDEASSVILSSATIGINFTDGDEIVMKDAMPGDFKTKTFTIETSDNASMPQQYSLYWDVEDFTFEHKEELVYSVSGTKTKDGKLISLTDKAMPTSTGLTEVAEGKIMPGELHTYTLKVEYKNVDKAQGYNNGCKFYGKIQIRADRIHYED